jgi:hypothetical protein
VASSSPTRRCDAGAPRASPIGCDDGGYDDGGCDDAARDQATSGTRHAARGTRHADEVFIRIQGVQQYLWRAVD